MIFALLIFLSATMATGIALLAVEENAGSLAPCFGRGPWSIAAIGRGGPMVFRSLAVIACLIVSMSVGGRTAPAQVIDPHELYERRCAGCHVPHAGEFVHDNLRSPGGKTVGHFTGRDIGIFLENHGRLEWGQIATVVQMIRRQLATQTTK